MCKQFAQVLKFEEHVCYTYPVHVTEIVLDREV